MEVATKCKETQASNNLCRQSQCNAPLLTFLAAERSALDLKGRAAERLPADELELVRGDRVVKRGQEKLPS